MFRTRKEELTLKEIKEYIKKHQAEKQRAENLQAYYEGKKVKNPYPKYVSDLLTGYFMGEPITYNSQNSDFLDKILTVFNLNNEAKHNKKLAKLVSVQGQAIEYLYLNEQAEVRFTAFSIAEMFLIYNASIEKEVLYAVRYFLLDGLYTIEIIDKENIYVLEGKDIEKAELIETRPHYFEEVPVAVYDNNEESQGDFEQIVHLIDSYDKVQDNTLQDLNDFTDAYLTLEGMQGTDGDDIAKFKKEKVLLPPEGSKAYWLIKSVNDNWVENYKNRVNRDIHKFSFTPDLTDEQFGSNLSGISLQYKLLAMEQLRGIKESEFKEGLNKRIKLICNVLKLKNSIDEIDTIEMQFNNSLPKNLFEISQIINNLAPYLSQDTLISLLPIIDDVKTELEKKKKERQTVMADYEETEDES